MSLTKEIVVARYKEDITWLLKLPPTWRITIYNKGPELPSEITTQPHITTMSIENKGREAETYAYHLMTRYSSYADLTVFVQGSPFDHAPEMLECLSVLDKRTEFSPEEGFIPLTIRYKSTFPSPRVTPRENRFYRTEDMSVKTLDFKHHRDYIGAPYVYSRFYSQYKQPLGINIMKYLFDSLEWETPPTSTIKFSYAACFAVMRSTIMQHSHDFYKRLYEASYATEIAPFLIERAWLHMFNQKFDSTKVLPEYSLQRKYRPTSRTCQNHLLL